MDHRLIGRRQVEEDGPCRIVHGLVKVMFRLSLERLLIRYNLPHIRDLQHHLESEVLFCCIHSHPITHVSSPMLSGGGKRTDFSFFSLVVSFQLIDPFKATDCGALHLSGLIIHVYFHFSRLGISSNIRGLLRSSKHCSRSPVPAAVYHYTYTVFGISALCSLFLFVVPLSGGGLLIFYLIR